MCIDYGAAPSYTNPVGEGPTLPWSLAKRETCYCHGKAEGERLERKQLTECGEEESDGGGEGRGHGMRTAKPAGQGVRILSVTGS